MEHDPDLAALQAALVDLLDGDVPLDTIPARLAEHAGDDADLRAWLASFEPAMLSTARALVRRWGRRTPPPEVSPSG